MIFLVIILYSLFFILLANKNFRLAVGLFIIGLPTYLIRFKIGPLPSTLLELNFGIIFVVWLLKFARADWPRIKKQSTSNKFFFILCSLFFLASLVSIFISDMWYYSFGQWRAYFLEPMLVFVMLLGRHGDSKPNNISTADLIWFLILSSLSISVFGIFQHFTGWHIGNVDWVALQTGRATSFFLSPNAVGLYLGPILPLIAYLILLGWKNRPARPIFLYFLVSLFLISSIVLVLTKSLGALVAVGAGALLFLFLVGRKKAAVAAILIASCLALSTYRFGLLQNKSRSGANRLTLWTYTENYLTASPKNFIFGTGIRQFFRKIQKPYYDVKKMERLIYPHNIFLNFWTETGLIGMLSFIGIFYFLFLISYKIHKNSNKLLGASLVTALIILLVHGLIDVPYFKNDLAMLFWICASIIISYSNQQLSNRTIEL